MRAILFCNLPYAISILKPLEEELNKRGFEYLWYVPKKLKSTFTYHDSPNTSDIKVLESFRSDMIFVPGNDVPWYLRGVKVQIFHGLAGEKKGHFRIRDYFDLYLTQGKYFTEKFNTLAQKHKNFNVTETGWCKLDKLFLLSPEVKERKKNLLLQSKAKKIILYAPTFSPSLTSTTKLFDEIVSLSEKEHYLILIKFHDKMDKNIKKMYQEIQNQRCIILPDDDITEALQIADIMISDTSSVVYEFLLLDKPLITLQSHSENIMWEDMQTPEDLGEKINTILYKEDTFQYSRKESIALYHPYKDSKSTKRMIDATLAYIDKYTVPKKRDISILRKIKMIKKYGLYRW